MESGQRRATAYGEIFGSRSGPRQPRGYEQNGGEQVQYTQYGYYGQHQQHPPGTQYYPPPPSQHQPPHGHAHYMNQQYAPHPPPQAPMYGPRAAPAPRPRSMLSGGGGRPVGIIPHRPLHEDAPDPAIERLTQQGLTPAQAYQAQYQRTPHGQRPFELPLVEVTPDPPMSGPWDKSAEYRDDDVRSDHGSIPSSRHSFYLPSQSPPPQTSPSQNTVQRPQLMHLNTTLAAQTSPAAHTTGDTQLSFYPSSSTSPSPPISNAPVNLNPSASRRSIESVRTVPVGTNTGSIGRRGHTYTGSIGNAPSDRTRSMSASASTVRPPVSAARPHHGSRKRPLVYPALLSRVADAFRQRIPLGDHAKDGLLYPVSFDGREAVDLIAHIIKTSDRNLALLLGRALDAQKFFHDVTYDHRLRDSPAEIYQFSGPRLASWETEGGEDCDSTPIRPGLLSPAQGSGSGTGSVNVGANLNGEEDSIPLPSGVFTLLTDCYSPTCSRDKVCYSLGCPRRIEQLHRQPSNRPQVANAAASTISILSGTAINVGSTSSLPARLLKGNSSKESLIDHGLKEPGQLWVHSVPQEVVDSVSDQEKKRQEAINEVIYTERDFVQDLEYLRDRWMEPLRTQDVVPESRRQDFVTQVFWNVEDILDVNHRLRDLLAKRQKAYPIVETIGDIFLEIVPHFQPFVQYGKHQLYGKYEFEKEKSTNPAFAAFVETVERLPESRKLELNGYLTKPTTRLARYPLLLEVVLKHTPEGNVDRVAIPKAVAMVRGFLAKVNEESGRTENRFNLLQLDKGLIFRPGEEVDLRLKDEQRQLVYKGPLKRRGGAASENGDLQVFLFDHALLMVKSKVVNKHEQLKVYKRPIPLELLVVTTPDENTNRAARPRTTLIRPTPNGTAVNGTPPPAPPIRPDSQKSGYQLTFSYLGKKGYSLTLWAATFVARKKWVEQITAQQEAMRGRSMMFDTYSLSEEVFVDTAKVNCAVPYDYGRRIAYGTDNGVYFQSLHDGVGKPARHLDLPDVQQIDILEDYQLLIVLSERSVITFPLDAFELDDPMRRAKRIASHTSFFKAGYCLGRTLVCVVKASSLSSTIKTLEPIDQAIRGKNKPTFKKLLQGGNDTLKVFKEFYIPTESHSIHFLKTKLCVACPKGFEIVDLETLDTQVLLDPVDVSLDFVQRRDDVRPLSIYRIDGEFLLCYTEFAFYVNKSGWRSKKDVVIYWEGNPTGFALYYPYVMAFDPMFIEIRNVEDGTLVQVIRGNNLRLLFADTQPSVMNSNMSSASSIRSSSSSIPPQYQSQFGYTHPYSGQSPYSQYSQPPGYGPPPHMNMHTQQLVKRRVHERDEIILGSDDKVMAVRLAPQPRESDMTVSTKTKHLVPSSSPYLRLGVATSSERSMPPPLDSAAEKEQNSTSNSEENIFDLLQLNEVLLFNDRETKQSLRLNDPARRLIHQGALRHKTKKKEYKVFLLDHALIITEPKVIGGRKRLRLVNHPTPIQLFRVSLEQTRANILGFIPLPRSKFRYQLRFSSHGKRFNNGRLFRLQGKPLKLLSPTADAAKAWVENVNAQRDANRQSTESNVLRLGQDILMGHGQIKVNCATLYADSQTIAYGTDDGVYFQPWNAHPRKAIDLTDVQQIDVLEDLSLLVILAERSVFTFPLDALDQFDRMNRMTRISRRQASFLKAGTCMGRTMVCIVKATPISSAVMILESSQLSTESNQDRSVKTSSADKANKLKTYKEFFLPAELYSVHFLKTKLCVAGSTGFEVVDLGTLDTQVLLDPADSALSFVGQYKNPRPLGVYRIKDDFLVCYREFAFYVNKTGWKSEKDLVIYWEGAPTACALQYPYIIAFSPDFVEIRHVDDGSLVQVIHKTGVRCLYAKCSPLWTNAEDRAPHGLRWSEATSTLISIGDKVMFLTQDSD
ncbi:unnamed protein product [Rhizoctonia solani]|uniref:Rho1 guanine nucleotide exchange factor 1 [Schizosaccharomyces pombe 972h-] n=1 Tax=Rhizoctonia solani TaxID=456999 RepID=A0A8H3A4D8_9AGAM|nr:unnamed protein product [Rhizoctonia solani]